MDAISCLPPPPPLHLSDAAAIARALHLEFSTAMSTSSSSSHHNHNSPLLAHLPSSYYVPSPTCCDSVLVADSPPGRQTQHRTNNHALAPAGARAGKRRSRASKRAPTTYISTDAANFRLMVQQITGVSGVETMAMLHHAQLLGAAAAGNPQLLPAGDDASAVREHQLQQQQQPCFPTLDSWNVSNVMYETNSAEML